MEFTNAVRHAYHCPLHFQGTPERVFPLLCPVREYDWIDGWSCTMIHSHSGVAEDGAIFRTAFPDVGEELWTVSRYEPPRAIGFIRVAPNVVVVKMDILLQPDGEGGTLAEVSHVYTALSHAGELLIQEATDPVHAAHTRTLETMANHYLRTGQRLPRPAEARPVKR